MGDGACGPGAHRRAQGPRTARPQACPSAWGRQAPWAASRQGCTVTVCGLREVMRDARCTPRARQAQGPEQARALPTPPPPSSRSGGRSGSCSSRMVPSPPRLEWSQGGAVALLGDPKPRQRVEARGSPASRPPHTPPYHVSSISNIRKASDGQPWGWGEPSPRRRGTRLRSIREGL